MRGGGSSGSSGFHSGGSSSSGFHAGGSSSDYVNHGGSYGSYGSSSYGSNSSYHSGSGRGWTIFGIVFSLVVVAVAIAAGLMFLASRGLLPDSVLRFLPFLESVRYQNLRSNFQSFGIGGGGGDDEYEEMYRRP